MKAKSKWSASLTYLGRCLLKNTVKTNFITYQTVDPDIRSTFIFVKGSATSFAIRFFV